MLYKKVELLTDARCIVGESPVWDERKERLLMVDIQGKRLRSIDWKSLKITETVLQQQAGFVVLRQDGGIVAGAEDGVYHVLPDGSFAPLSQDFVKKGERFNDGKVGPDGRLYLGTFSRDGSAAFYRMEADGAMTELFDGVGNSNGLDFDEKKGVMYYNDTPTGRTDVFRFDSEKGLLSERRTVFSYQNGEPDGMTMDAEGNLWTAVWGSGAVVCVNPYTGQILHTVALPVSQVACCAFAGKDLKSLVITNAAHCVHLMDEPLAGAVFVVQTDVCGLTVNRLE